MTYPSINPAINYPIAIDLMIFTGNFKLKIENLKLCYNVML